jgi:hypothetical protein
MRKRSYAPCWCNVDRNTSEEPRNRVRNTVATVQALDEDSESSR